MKKYIIEVISHEHPEAIHRMNVESALDEQTLEKILGSVSSGYDFSISEYDSMNPYITLESAISEVQQLKLVVAAYALTL